MGRHDPCLRRGTRISFRAMNQRVVLRFLWDAIKFCWVLAFGFFAGFSMVVIQREVGRVPR